jgi:hypothetical protein
MPFLLLLAALMTGGGLFFAFRLWRRAEVYVPYAGVGRTDPTTAINPSTVGAFGFAAWLSNQAPLLNYGERVVLSKVGNGIRSAMHLVGQTPDLKKISEMGTQESLQLTTSSPILPAAVWGTGFAEG